MFVVTFAPKKDIFQENKVFGKWNGIFGLETLIYILIFFMGGWGGGEQQLKVSQCNGFVFLTDPV